LRAVIFANGNIAYPHAVKAAIRQDDLLIAADGGARNCISLGLTPTFVIGDMDSIASEQRAALEAGQTRFITFPRNKDQTDLELAIGFATQQGAGEILLLGLLGGRLDQTLANLLLLSREEWNRSRLVVIEGPDTAYILHDRDSLSIPGDIGDIVSLLPLSPQVTGVTTQNLQWPLVNATLHFGSTLSISNEMVSSPVEVKIHRGTMLVVHRIEEFENT